MPDRLQIRAPVMTVNRGNRYPYDIHWHADRAAVARLYADSDVIHLNNVFNPYCLLDKRRRKPLLMHQHGSIFRSDPRRHLHLAKRHNAEVAVSTVDLLKPAPDAMTWLPTAYNIDELRAIRAAHRRADDGVIRIAHAPTNREVKSTDALMAAVDALKADGLPIELDVIEDQPWSECLRRKAAADVYFDQVQLGYGCNAVEAWGMGMPVIAGAQPWTLNRMRIEYGSDDLPFYEATEQTIADALRALVISADARAEYTARGTAHVERFHAEEPALARLVDLYTRAIARRGKSASKTRAA